MGMHLLGHTAVAVAAAAAAAAAAANVSPNTSLSTSSPYRAAGFLPIEPWLSLPLRAAESSRFMTSFPSSLIAAQTQSSLPAFLPASSFVTPAVRPSFSTRAEGTNLSALNRLPEHDNRHYSIVALRMKAKEHNENIERQSSE